MSRWLGVCSAWVTCVALGAGIDESQLLPVEEAFKPSVAIVDEGGPTVVVDFKVADGYYLFRERMKFAVPSPASLGPARLPEGDWKDDPTFGRTTVYHEDVQARMELRDAGETVPFTLTYQGCADVGICYPPQRLQLQLRNASATAASLPQPSLLKLDAPGGGLLGHSGGAPGAVEPLMDASQDALPEDQAFRFEAIATGPDQFLLRFTPADGYYLYRDKTELRLQDVPDGYGMGLPVWPEAEDHHDEHFGTVKVYFRQIEVPVELTRPAGPSMRASVQASFQGCKDQGICYPVMTRTVALELPASDADHVARQAAPDAGAQVQARVGTSAPGVSTLPFWLALVSAFLGGLILNLMPCVLPVLSLKALSVIDSGKSRDYARSQSNWYTLGTLASFGLIGLLVVVLSKTGNALSWGFQFQHSWFVSGLVVLMAVIGLSLSGVVTFGNSLMGVGQSLTEDSGRKGAFFTGVLAVIVASPCTAPMMGAALAFAFVQPPLQAMSVFLALGLGLAFPFLLIGYVPALAARLPRPGAWMEGFKQMLAFPMYFTAVWLTWVLGQQKGIDAVGYVLVACVLVAWAAWWWERSKYREPRSWFARIGVVALLIMGLMSLREIERLAPFSAVASVSKDALPKTPFSEESLAELRAKNVPVFVDMTAAWCATCKVNERVALNTDAFRSALNDTQGVLMVGDWTNSDPAISAYLKRYGAVGVPLYVVYPKGGGAGEVLPTVLTPGIASEALRRAAQ